MVSFVVDDSQPRISQPIHWHLSERLMAAFRGCFVSHRALVRDSQHQKRSPQELEPSYFQASPLLVGWVEWWVIWWDSRVGWMDYLVAWLIGTMATTVGRAGLTEPRRATSWKPPSQT